MTREKRKSERTKDTYLHNRLEPRDEVVGDRHLPDGRFQIGLVRLVEVRARAALTRAQLAHDDQVVGLAHRLHGDGLLGRPDNRDDRMREDQRDQTIFSTLLSRPY
jgi:hypothetical protein